MKAITYRKKVDPETAMMLSIPETAARWDISEYSVRKLARQCGAYLRIGGTTRILQKEFAEHVRSFAITD